MSCLVCTISNDFDSNLSVCEPAMLLQPSHIYNQHNNDFVFEFGADAPLRRPQVALNGRASGSARI